MMSIIDIVQDSTTCLEHSGLLETFNCEVLDGVDFRIYLGYLSEYLSSEICEYQKGSLYVVDI